ncbi:MAG: NADH-quinone oxidoreductase subunit H [Anaerolineaceae bacterium]|nr:NADH-quinone oxidoreductase subunit H [Anaerolineaceae bacterium]
MNNILPVIAMLLFPGGITLILGGQLFEWIDRKLVARYQNRLGPRWYQPFADTIKSLSKEEVVPSGVNTFLFIGLPVIGLAAALTSGLYVPLLGFEPVSSFRGDLIVVLYMLSVMTLCLGVAGANTLDHFSLVGATRTLTQLFSYEAPFMLALLGPALVAKSWQISEINQFMQNRPWFLLTQPIGFIVALIGLMGKLELPPFDAPEAETEIVSGALTEYSGRGLALFHIGQDVELFIGVTLIVTFYLGGLANPLQFILKSIGLLVVLTGLQSLFARLRIDQTVGLWWRIGALLALIQMILIIVVKG